MHVRRCRRAPLYPERWWQSRLKRTLRQVAAPRCNGRKAWIDRPRKRGFAANGERLVRGRVRDGGAEREAHAAARRHGYRLFTTSEHGDVAIGYNLTKIFRKFDLKMDKKRCALRTPYSRLSASVLLKAARQQTPSEMGQGHEILVQGRILAHYRRSAVAVEREERIGTAGRRHRSGFSRRRSGVRHASVLHAS